MGPLTDLTLKDFKNFKKAFGVSSILDTHKYDVLLE
jgi:hypothetical protein